MVSEPRGEAVVLVDVARTRQEQRAPRSPHTVLRINTFVLPRAATALKPCFLNIDTVPKWFPDGRRDLPGDGLWVMG